MELRRSSGQANITRKQRQRQLIKPPSSTSHVAAEQGATPPLPLPVRRMPQSCSTSSAPLNSFALRCMETFHPDGNPLAAYLEGHGSYESDSASSNDKRYDVDDRQQRSFAPPSWQPRIKKWKNSLPTKIQEASDSPTSRRLTRFHNAWSSAVNSWLGRADNERFLEHFRYIIVASQLLEQYLDHGSLNPAVASGHAKLGLDGASDTPGMTQKVPTSVYGAAGVTVVAMVIAFMLDRFRTQRSNVLSKGRVGLVLMALTAIAVVGYGYNRRLRLRSLRQQAVDGASTLTATWQAFELSSTSALAFIQEVELVSKGFRLSTPLPPVSRIEGNSVSRRCAKLRSVLFKAYAETIPAYIAASDSLRALITEDDLERYFDVYDISLLDAREASVKDTATSIVDDDPESLKSLRVLSYRAAILRRVTLCSFMALEADGGHPDFPRWRTANSIITKLSTSIAASAERIRVVLSEMDSISIPLTPPKPSGGYQHSPSREKMRSQVRKISTLSSGIRGLQAKMQILREETSKNIEQTEDLTDLGPSLMAQYESIGTDLKELMQAWEEGKQSLQSNITKQERRISMASSSGGLRSPVSSLGGLTAVSEGGGGFPDDALRVLNGDNPTKSNRSSMTPSSCYASDTEGDITMVFEAVALPRVRRKGSLVQIPREERILKMQEERDRQAAVRAKRDASVSLLRELESVISLKGKQGEKGGMRTSL